MQGARGKPTNYHADIHRRKILEYAQNNPWFTITEASQDLRIKRHTVAPYVMELANKGMLTGRVRQHDLSSRPPMEYLFKDTWHLVTESNDPVVRHHHKIFSEVADIYRQGLIPVVSTLPWVMEGLGDEIRVLEERLRLLKLIYNNPDMQKVQTFVKRMGTNEL